MKSVRSRLVGWLQVVMIWLLHVCRLVLGEWFIKMNFRLFSQLATTASVLRVLGATVGINSHIYSDICIYNAEHWSCHNLNIGSNVYIGPRCLFDLTAKVIIADNASISAQVSFITHLDVGEQPLKASVSRREGPIHVGNGAWIGVNTTILHGVTIGKCAMVGAMSLVNRAVPDGCVAFGIPSRVVRESDKHSES